ncbi:MAG: hypothetical protein ACLRZH_18500 [Ruthenibacterium lactatiformans]
MEAEGCGRGVCAGIYYPEFKLYGASTDLKHTECAPQHLKMRGNGTISPVSVRISGSGADPNMAARQLPPSEEAMNEPFYHYSRNAELVFPKWLPHHDLW